MEITLSAVAILFLIGLGLPIAFSFLSGTLIFVTLSGGNTTFITSVAYQSLDSFALMAIPFYLVAGDVMNTGGLAKRLIDFAGILIYKIKGGLGAIIPLASAFFGALTGSGTATVAAIGSIMIPRLEKFGYDRRYTAALAAASGSLGYLIPPSMLGIIYGVVSDTSIAAMFLATIFPGILWGLLNIIINAVCFTKWRVESDKKLMAEIQQGDNGSRFLLTAWRAIPAFMMPVIILGGIYGGIFTPTEAGAISCIYALPVGVLIYREIKAKEMFKVLSVSAHTFGVLMIILAMVLIYTRILVTEGIPQSIACWLSTLTGNKYVMLFVLNIIFIIAGMFLDAVTLTLIMTPLMTPAAIAMGIDPIHLGTILLVNIGIGTFTPPMATNLFVAARIGGVTFQSILRPLIPFFLFGGIPTLILTTYFPWMSLWLPKVLLGSNVLRAPIAW